MVPSSLQVRLAMSKATEALGDSEEAVELDPTYSKAFYRKGQSLDKLKRVGGGETSGKCVVVVDSVHILIVAIAVTIAVMAMKDDTD